MGEWRQQNIHQWWDGIFYGNLQKRSAFFFVHYWHYIYTDYFIWRDVHNVLLSVEREIQDALVTDNVWFFSDPEFINIFGKSEPGFSFWEYFELDVYVHSYYPAKFLCWNQNYQCDDWRQEEKGMTENEMVGWHHQLNGHEFEQALGLGDGQGSLACCSPWGLRIGHNWMTELNWAECDDIRRWDVLGTSDISSWGWSLMNEISVFIKRSMRAFSIFPFSSSHLPFLLLFFLLLHLHSLLRLCLFFFQGLKTSKNILTRHQLKSSSWFWISNFCKYEKYTLVI